MQQRNRFLTFGALWLACLCGLAHGDGLRLGLGQELGRDGHITTEGRSGSDYYSESSFRVGLDHPVLFFNDKMMLDPIIGVSYIKYLEFSNLDTVGFEISGPLTLQLEGVGDESDTLRVSAGVSRDSGAVSSWNPVQTTSTTLGADALYTRHWGSPRWKSEFGYRYDQRLYDDAIYRDQDRTTHTLSAAMLYALNREVSVGARTSYAMENFKGEGWLDADTWDVLALARWQITGKVDSELAVGPELVSYRDDGSDSGVAVRGRLSYQANPRLQFSGTLRHEMEAADRAGQTGETTDAGELQVSYRFTPKLTGRALPGVRTRTGDDQVTEITFAVEATYSFSLVDVTFRTGVRDRSSDRGGDDSYVAVDTAIRVVWTSGHEPGQRQDLRRLGRRH